MLCASANPYSSSNANACPFPDCDTFTCAESNTISNTFTHPDTDEHPSPDANLYSHSDTDSYANSHANSYSHSRANTYCN